jgi:hypothetical protein
VSISISTRTLYGKHQILESSDPTLHKKKNGTMKKPSSIQNVTKSSSLKQKQNREDNSIKLQIPQLSPNNFL